MKTKKNVEEIENRISALKEIIKIMNKKEKKNDKNTDETLEII